MHEAQERQAKKMVRESHPALQPLELCKNARVPIPRVDRGLVDPANLLGVVTSITDNGYRIGTPSGLLDKAFSRNQVKKCAQNIIEQDVVPERSLTVRSTVAEESVATGQGFIHCNCKTAAMVAGACKKSNVLCNSRCHHSLSCSNK